MPRVEQPLPSDGTVLTEFAQALREVRRAAGKPAYRALAARAHYSSTTLADAAGGKKLPSLAVTLAFAKACGADTDEWERRWHTAASTLAAEALTRTPTKAGPGEADGAAPYLGLRAYQAGDAARFRGREELVARLRDLVAGHRFVTVVGASGAGKSSLLRAGLVAAAEQAGQPAVAITPGPHPVEEIALALAAGNGASARSLSQDIAADPAGLHFGVRELLAVREPAGDLLVVVDQFEELFTLCRYTAEREAFLAALVTAASSATSHTRVVVGLRADFFAHCCAHSDLAQAMNDAQLVVGPMTSEQLRTAVTGPAIDAGLSVESALLAEVLAEASGEPGALPLVSHALLQAWRRRRGTVLTLTGYQAAGGIRHALAQTAETAYDDLSPAQQATARDLFIRLTALGENTQDTKRRLRRRELDSHDTDLEAVLDSLAAARLIVLDHDTVEIGHEALIRAWPRLRAWLEADREELLLHRQLTDTARTWTDLERDDGVLYRGTRLARTRVWRDTHNPVLLAEEAAFLQASIAAHDRERETELRSARRLRRLVAVLAALLLVAALATGYAVESGRAATEQRDTALAHKVFSQAQRLRETNPGLALQLELAAHRLSPQPELHDDLLSGVSAPLPTPLTGNAGQITATAASHAGHLFAAADLDSKVVLWDIANPRRPDTLATLSIPESAVTATAFGMDGRTLATGSLSGEIRLWDLTEPRQPRQLSVVSAPDAVASLAFSPDDRTLSAGTTAKYDPDPSRPSRDNLGLWDVRDRAHPARMSSPRFGSDVMAAVFTGEGRVLATGGGDGVLRLWAMGGAGPPSLLAERTARPGAISSIAVSPSGNILATGDTTSAQLWDITDPLHPAGLAVLPAIPLGVSSLDFSPDGHTLATSGDDKLTRLWSVGEPARPQQALVFGGHAGKVSTVLFTADGRSFATAGEDKVVQLYDVPELAFAGMSGMTTSVATGATGVAAFGGADGITRLWGIGDPEAPRSLAELPGHARPTLALAVSGDGRLLATADADGVLNLWDITDPRNPSKKATTSVGGTFSWVTFSGDAHYLATSDTVRTRLWDITDTTRLLTLAALPDYSGGGGAAAFAPDGRTLATDSNDNSVKLWDLSDRRRPALRASLSGHQKYIAALAFSPDGRTLASGGGDTTVRLWDVADLRRVGAGTVLTGHTDNVVRIAFSPDGRTLASGSKDSTVRLWSMTGPFTAGPAATLSGHTNGIDGVAFGPDGSHIVAGASDGTTRYWTADFDQATRRICAVSPPLGESDWKHYFPGIDYRPPCENNARG
ncbi:nSTAND1 domain-containing NTPase [Amycolatopsis speibonae]|uniref:HTH cro/C1-type domain-containing protein n=1 Tax=Amycolatopsis speibonae TaxID=1450224 RepID=A0ABV7NS31_9PSEU